ncbi:MAG: hypothetical protein KatS3mg008_1863 [Acidimicrobiales bacterium]|nr:MAG: hypothetical protein KatS3mg008_1863 [Acidimicrobiales bacterium]
MRRFRSGSVLVLVGVLLVGACSSGDDGDKSASPTGAGEQATTTVADSGGADGSDEQSGGSRDESGESGDSPDSDSGQGGGGSDVGNLPFVGSEECTKFAATFSLTLGQAAGAAFGSSPEDIQKMRDSLEELGAYVPDEIEEDWKIVSEAFDRFFSVAAEKGMASPELETVAEETIQDPKVEQSMDRIGEWVEKNCGVPMTPNADG